MLVTKVPILTEILQEYYEPGELKDVARLFGIELPELWSSAKQEWLAVARQLVEQLEQGNHHALLQTLLEQLEIKNTAAIAHTDWEQRTAHERLRPKIAELQAAFEKAGAPAEIAVSEGSPFSRSHRYATSWPPRRPWSSSWTRTSVSGRSTAYVP